MPIESEIQTQAAKFYDSLPKDRNSAILKIALLMQTLSDYIKREQVKQ